MNKQQIITAYNLLLKELDLPASKVVLGAGAALVLHGGRIETNDLDVDVPSLVFDKLRKTMQVKQTYGLNDYIEYLPGVDLHSMQKNTDTTTVDGVCVYTLSMLLHQKQQLVSVFNRSQEKHEQDIIDIGAILKLMYRARG